MGWRRLDQLIVESHTFKLLYQCRSIDLKGNGVNFSNFSKSTRICQIQNKNAGHRKMTGIIKVKTSPISRVLFRNSIIRRSSDDHLSAAPIAFPGHLRDLPARQRGLLRPTQQSFHSGALYPLLASVNRKRVISVKHFALFGLSSRRDYRVSPSDKV